MFTIVKTVYTYKFNDFNIKIKMRVNEKKNLMITRKWIMSTIKTKTNLLKKTNFVAFVLRFVS